MCFSLNDMKWRQKNKKHNVHMRLIQGFMRPGISPGSDDFLVSYHKMSRFLLVIWGCLMVKHDHILSIFGGGLLGTSDRWSPYSHSTLLSVGFVGFDECGPHEKLETALETGFPEQGCHGCHDLIMPDVFTDTRPTPTFVWAIYNDLSRGHPK